MINEEIKNKITDLLYDQLSEDEAIELRAAIDSDPNLAEEYDRSKRMVQRLKGLPTHTSPPNSSLRFKQWLEAQRGDLEVNSVPTKVRSINFWKYGIAASIVLVLGIFIGQKLVKENQQLLAATKSKETLFQLVANESTMSRIEGINRSLELKTLDPEVRDVLLNVLANDKSTNVRLAALDALSGYTGDPLIKSNLIKLLGDDSQPIIQISIINVLVEFKEQDVRESLESLIGQEGLMDDVRDEAILGMTRL